MPWIPYGRVSLSKTNSSISHPFRLIWSHVHCISSQPSQSVSNKWTKPTQTRTHRLQKTLSIVCFPVRRKTIHLPILIDCQSYSSMWKHLPDSVDVRGGYKLWKFSSVCHHGENWPNGDCNRNVIWTLASRKMSSQDFDSPMDAEIPCGALFAIFRLHSIIRWLFADIA